MYPRLLHPIPVYIRQIDRKNTAVFDHSLHEPVGQVERPQKPIRLVAQISRADTDKPIAVEGGVLESTNGYCLFRTSDLREAGVVLDRGDRIVQIGEGENMEEVDLYIMGFLNVGHYPKARGATLRKAYFADRHPSRQRGDL